MSAQVQTKHKAVVINVNVVIVAQTVINPDVSEECMYPANVHPQMTPYQLHITSILIVFGDCCTVMQKADGMMM